MNGYERMRVVMTKPIKSFWPCSRSVCVLILAWGLHEGIPSAQAYEGDPATTGVTVSGRVSFSGTVPKSYRLPVHRDSAFCGESVTIETLHLDPGTRGVEDVVVSLEGITKGKPVVPEKAGITFENRTCKFIPRVKATNAESILEIKNADPILHNTHVRHANRFGPTVINVVQPAGTSVIRRPLHITGLLDIRCDAHTFMHAAFHVFEHPYFSMTDSTGWFELTEVPPGTYKVRIWHETLGSRTRTITVPATGSVTLNLEISQEE